MRSFSIGKAAQAGILALALVALAGCHRGASKDDLVQAANIPAGFDLTLIAAKDNQFDYDGAPLTEEDFKSAMRYRKEEKLPLSTVLLKRGEKDKIKKEHIIALARVAYLMGFKAYIQPDEGGEISEILAKAKDPDEGDKKVEASPDKARQ